jgi:hypothetical protein
MMYFMMLYNLKMRARPRFAYLASIQGLMQLWWLAQAP